MGLTKYAIGAMGYKEFSKADVLIIDFGIIRAYSLQGICFEQDCKEKRSEVFSLSERCTVIITESIAEAWKLLTGDVGLTISHVVDI